MHWQISPRRTCNPCGYTMKMIYRYQSLLIYNVKITTKIDGMGHSMTLTLGTQVYTNMCTSYYVLYIYTYGATNHVIPPYYNY